MKKINIILVVLLLIALTTFAEEKFSPSVISFTTGQVSPLLEARYDFAKYDSSCRTVENMLVSVMGPLERRPGTKYIAEVKDSSNPVRLIPFEYSTDDTYMIEFGDLYARFYRNEGQILTSGGGGTEDLSALDNIIAHWTLNDDAATAVVVDADGATYNGVASGNTEDITETGRVNSCFNLDSTYAVVVTDSNDPNFTFVEGTDGNFSIVGWAYVTEQSDEQVLISKWYEGNAREWKLSLDGTQKLKMSLADESIFLDSDLVADYRMNDSAATASVVDSRNSNTGTLSDGVSNYTSDHSVAGKISNALNFDGTDDYVSLPDSDDNTDIDITGNMTLAMWVNMDNLDSCLFSNRFYFWNYETGYFLGTDDGKIVFACGNNNYLQAANVAVSTGVITISTWTHIAAVKSGVNVTFYINGSVAGTDTVGNATIHYDYSKTRKIGMTDSYGGTPYSGALGFGSKQYTDGRIDNFFIFNKALSAAEISSLYNFGEGIESLGLFYHTATTTNAVDAGWKFISTTYNGNFTGGVEEVGKGISFAGTAQMDSSQYKFGSQSLELDGDSDYVLIADSADWDLADGDFTVETWVRFNALPADGYSALLINQWPTTSRGWATYISNTGGVYTIDFGYSTDGSAAVATSSNTITLAVDTWYHFAWVRCGATLTMYQNGVAKGTVNMTGVTVYNSTAQLSIGAHSGPVAGYYTNGWMDEVRITKGEAKWSTAFTPETAAYTADTNDVLLAHFDSNGLLFYVDGSAVGSDAVSNPFYSEMEDTAALVRIGADYSSAGAIDNIWSDKLDNIVVLGDVLTPTEVASLCIGTTIFGSIYEIATPYLVADLNDIQYVQSDNDLYLVHGDYEPRRLNRIQHNEWTLSALGIKTGPFQNENTNIALTITPSATTESITLTASDVLFRSGHVGSIWQISQPRDTSVFTGSLATDANSTTTVYFTGDYSFTTTGTWDATVALQRSTDDGTTWENALSPLNSVNFDNPAEIEKSGAIYRVLMSDRVSGTCVWTFIISSSLNNGTVEITAYTSSTSVTATVISDLANTDATSKWREGYLSDYRGWPKTVEFYQQRLVLGGSESYPQVLWFGKQDPDDYINFTRGTLDTSAFTIALEGQNPIRWLLSQDYLLIGSSNSCGKWGEQGKAVTPTSPNYQTQSPYGSAAFQAVIGGNEALYVERGGRNIRRFGYDLQSDKFISSNLTILSPEITDSGIKDIAFQYRPEPVMWCVLNNGDIATLIYQKDQSVVAWAKQTTDGDFESVATIPSSTGTEDEVWVSVLRTINGKEVRYIEMFQPRVWGSDPNDAWFVDSGISYDDDPNSSFTGAEHLIGETVSVYADRLIESSEVVDANGGLTIDNAASRVLIGLPYTSKLETLPLVIHPQDKVTNKKINRVWFDVYKTGALSYGNGADSTLTTWNFNNSLDIDPNATAQDWDVYPGTSVVKPLDSMFVYGSMKKQTVYIESSMPMPLTIRSITPVYNMYNP